MRRGEGSFTEGRDLGGHGRQRLSGRWRRSLYENRVRRGPIVERLGKYGHLTDTSFIANRPSLPNVLFSLVPARGIEPPTC